MTKYTIFRPKLTKLLTPSLFLCLFIVFLSSCDSKNYETCGGQPACPPFDEKAAPDIQKLRADIAGKWKLMTIAARDTFHKTEKTYNTQRFGLCISYNGGILLHKDYKDVVCTYCFEFKKEGDKYQLALDESAANTFCAEALQTSEVNIQGDSMILFRRDSFITKRIVYRRTNDDWSLKVN
jgi:hypothetical protein